MQIASRQRPKRSECDSRPTKESHCSQFLTPSEESRLSNCPDKLTTETVPPDVAALRSLWHRCDPQAPSLTGEPQDLSSSSALIAHRLSMRSRSRPIAKNGQRESDETTARETSPDEKSPAVRQADFCERSSPPFSDLESPPVATAVACEQKSPDVFSAALSTVHHVPQRQAISRQDTTCPASDETPRSPGHRSS